MSKNKMLYCFHCGNTFPATERSCPDCNKALLRSIDHRFSITDTLCVDKDMVTFLGKDRSNFIPVIIKVVTDPCNIDARSRLLNEADILVKFNHSGIFQKFIYAGDLQSSGHVYTVLQSVDGEPLDKVCKKASPTFILETIIDVLATLRELHNEGWAHLNLCPGNIVIKPNGYAVLTDLSRVRKNNSRNPGSGVPGFKAPEQYRIRGSVGHYTDVFAIGCIVYKLLTKKYPYPTTNKRLRQFPLQLPLRPSEINLKLTRDLDDIIRKALDIDSQDRYQDAQALLTELSNSYTHTTIVDYQVPKAQIPQQPAPNVAIPNQAQQLIFYVRMKQILHQAYNNIAQSVSNLPRNWKLAAIGVFLLLLVISGRLFPNNKAPAQILEPARVIYFEEPTITPPLKASFRAFSWPAADVFVDDEFIGEAPDPTLYTIEAGNHTIEFITRAGENRKFTQHFESGEEYTFKINFETDE